MIQRPFLSTQSNSFHSGTPLQSQPNVIEGEVRTITTSLMLFSYNDKSGIIIHTLMH